MSGQTRTRIGFYRRHVILRIEALRKALSQFGDNPVTHIALFENDDLKAS